MFYSTLMSNLVLGTRGSALALAQSGMVKQALEARGHAVRLEVIQTTGDRDQTSALSRIVRPATGEPFISNTHWCGSASATARPVEITMVPGSLSDSKP